MTTTDETPVNGHKTNLADLAPFRPLAPRSVGPADPIEHTQPIPTVDSSPSEVDSANETEHQDQPEPLPAPVQPEEPPLPELPPNPDEDTHPFRVDRVYWGNRALVAVYWIAIATGAIGQVVFFGSLFGLGAWGYAAAAVIATTAETVMVASGDTALKHRIYAEKKNKKRWVPFLLVSFAAASAACGMNLSHFWHINISLALLFGGVSLLGYLLHIIDGFVQGSDYLDRKDTYEQAVAERDRQARLRAQARYERELAEWESARQAARRAVEQAEQTEPAPAQPDPTPEPAPAEPKPSRGEGKKKSKPATHRPPRPTDEQIAACWRDNGHPGATRLRTLLVDQGFAEVGESTLRGKIAPLKQGHGE